MIPKNSYTLRKAQSAITFIELLIVIIIIGVLSAISIPQFKKTVENHALEAFVKDIYYLCRYLQASAISQEKVFCLNINQGEHKFWGTYIEGDEFKKIPDRFGKTYQAPADAIISTDKPVIYFYPDGSIDTATINFDNEYNNKISLIIKGALGEIKIQ
jgi:prepilin-type N-terminal cleavage/methylation domain-containing protein